MLDRWVEFGVRDVGGGEVKRITGEDGKGGEVTLSTTRHQENFTYYRPSHQAFDAEGKKLIHPELVPDLDPNSPNPDYPFYRAEPSIVLSQLPTLRPSVLYILGETSNVATPELVSHRLRITGQGPGGSGRVDSVTLEGRGHLIAMEVPGECARLAGGWMKSEVARWWAGEGKRFEEWKARGQEEKTTMGAAWYDFIHREKPKI